ncbi:MAG: hypothetical protein HQK49_21360 [Oligoflexia bacterium]|nr:hypothetical protein [Oligoflexia bacterium]
MTITKKNVKMFIFFCFLFLSLNLSAQTDNATSTSSSSPSVYGMIKKEIRYLDINPNDNREKSEKSEKNFFISDIDRDKKELKKDSTTDTNKTIEPTIYINTYKRKVW